VAADRAGANDVAAACASGRFGMLTILEQPPAPVGRRRQIGLDHASKHAPLRIEYLSIVLILTVWLFERR